MSVAHEPAQQAAAEPADFDALYRRLWAPLMQHALRTFGARDAEEITQETFLRSYSSLDLTRSEGEMWVWLTTVARNVATDVRRRRKHCDAAAELPEVHESRTAHLPEAAALASEKRRLLRRELDGLPELQRTMVLLHELEGRRLSEIAEILGLSEPCVRKSLQRVRRRLAHRLDVLRGPAGLLAPLPLLQGLLDRIRPARTASLAAGVAGVAVLGSLTFGALPGFGGHAETVSALHAERTAVAATVPARAESTTAAARPVAAEGKGQTPTAVPASKLVKLPSTPLSPGHRHHVGVRVPVADRHVVVSEDLATTPVGGVVCSSSLVDCD
jgi:RNA polymerase sigma-70 factor (ECF subfamily)